ncbi:MAG: glucose-6-phosphate isomerase family protein, partial [bacterium]|nr:glucose-6-phosphate isomerase family protein [bacterium]
MAIYVPRTREEMKEVLAFPEAPGPEVFYHMLRDATGNLTIWEPGEVGGEYIKVFGHYHRDDIKETYRVIYGEGLAFWQKRAVNASGLPVNEEIAEAKIFPIKT